MPNIHNIDMCLYLQSQTASQYYTLSIAHSYPHDILNKIHVCIESHPYGNIR